MRAFAVGTGSSNGAQTSATTFAIVLDFTHFCNTRKCKYFCKCSFVIFLNDFYFAVLLSRSQQCNSPCWTACGTSGIITFREKSPDALHFDWTMSHLLTPEADSYLNTGWINKHKT